MEDGARAPPCTGEDNMTLKLVGGIVAVIALATSPLSADQTTAGVRAGVAVPVAGIDGPFDSAFTFAGWLSRPLRGPIGWRVEVGHDRQRLAGLLRSLCEGAGARCDAHVGVTYVAGGVQFGADPAREIAPFGYVTAGLYRVGIGATIDGRIWHVGTTSVSTAENDVGVSVGGGFRFALTERWGVFAEARYTGFTVGRHDTGWASLLTGAASLAFGF